MGRIGLPERPLRYSGEAELPYWPTFIEKLLLAIIDANPLDGRPPPERADAKDRDRRLDTALEALFGKSFRPGPKIIYILHAAVAAAKSQATGASMEAFERTVLSLPKAERTRKMSKSASFRNSDKLVRGQSKGSRRDRLKYFEADHREYLQQVGLGHAHPEEDDMLEDLFAIARILSRWQVSARVDPEALGMASLWGANGR